MNCSACGFANPEGFPLLRLLRRARDPDLSFLRCEVPTGFK